MNVEQVEAIAQLVRTLSEEERALLAEKLQPTATQIGDISEAHRSALDLARPWVGCVDDGPEDLATNPDHLKGYGAS